MEFFLEEHYVDDSVNDERFNDFDLEGNEGNFEVPNRGAWSAIVDHSDVLDPVKTWHHVYGKTSPPTQPAFVWQNDMSNEADRSNYLFQTVKETSPDVIRISGAIGNCIQLRKMFHRAAIIMPKFLIVPINPTIPPPIQIIPDFDQHYLHHAHEFFFLDSTIWLGHCSVSAVSALLREKHPYVLLQVDLTQAVFVLESLIPVLRPEWDFKDDGLHVYTQFQTWLRGWYCNNAARYAGSLETLLGYDYIDFSTQDAGEMEARICQHLRDFGVPMISGCGVEGRETDFGNFDFQPVAPVIHRQYAAAVEIRELPGMKYAMIGRGMCVNGLCTCFPPYRGADCKTIQPTVTDRPYEIKGALGTLLPDRTHHVEAFIFAAKKVWKNFNHQYGYPYIVFHDGMSIGSKMKIITALPDMNFWFLYVDGYADLPEEVLENVPHMKFSTEKLMRASLGYRGSCRFMAGGLFEQEVLTSKAIEYLLWFDSDAYLPLEAPHDIIYEMYLSRNTPGETPMTYGYSHFFRESPPGLRHFYEFALMYLYAHGMEVMPKGTLLDAITKEYYQPILGDLYAWDHALIMADIQLLYTPYFIGGDYMNWFKLKKK